MSQMDVTDEEIAEIFSALWFNMDIDFRQFSIMDESHRAADSERFAEVNQVRYVLLSKLVGLSEGRECYSDMKQVLVQAGDIMLIARGVQNGGD